jgi:hypothetical protein
MSDATDEKGSGDQPARGRADLAELRLLRRALRVGCKIDDAMKEMLVGKLRDELQRVKGLRATAALARTIDALERTELAAVETAIRADQHERLSQRLDELERKAGDEQGEGDGI